jgi:hypothetical protein
LLVIYLVSLFLKVKMVDKILNSEKFKNFKNQLSDTSNHNISSLPQTNKTLLGINNNKSNDRVMRSATKSKLVTNPTRGRIVFPSIISNQSKPIKSVISSEPKVISIEHLSPRVPRNRKTKADSGITNPSDSNQNKTRKRNINEVSNEGISILETSRTVEKHPGSRTKKLCIEPKYNKINEDEEGSQGEEGSSAEESDEMSPIEEEPTPGTSRNIFNCEVSKSRSRNQPESGMKEARFPQLRNRVRDQADLLKGETSFRVVSNSHERNQPESLREEASFRMLPNSRARNLTESIREEASFRMLPNSRARNQTESIREEASFRMLPNSRARNQTESIREEASFRMLPNSRARNLPRMGYDGYYQNESRRGMDDYYLPEESRRPHMRDCHDEEELLDEASTFRIPAHRPYRRHPEEFSRDIDSDTRFLYTLQLNFYHINKII